MEGMGPGGGVGGRCKRKFQAGGKAFRGEGTVNHWGRGGD